MDKSTHSAPGFPFTARNSGSAARFPHPIHNPHQDSEPCEENREREIKTVLLVSNDDYLRPLIRAYLEHVGFAVIACTEACRAPQIARDAPNPMLLLLDLISAGTEGLQIALQFAGLHSAMPAVIIAGPRLTDAELDIVNSHEWKLLRRPVRLPDLLAVIQHAFDRNRLLPASRPSLNSGQASFPFQNTRRSGPQSPSSSGLALIWRRPEGDDPRS